ncbi:unnamed protein product [Clavelina lepadiformis]|uniref:small monomeric GTPase n=1 Tax=Clavelina lepadiformis TaxID=159417 RepID=A0ABP0FUJ6_CLALP
MMTYHFALCFSAMTVRFVTKRFIGDYDPTLETIYRHTSVVDDQLVNFEIMDTAGQDENSLMLEDKCKWGESFIFVYDVTDKYSFDELTRLKFIASYTHSRMRLNFTPCWILVGNKSDLAEQERMVTVEEGKALAQDLGCHLFREISVRESITDATDVFEAVWREFSRRSPRSPSSSHRRKFSGRIQDKIPVLNSAACTCASEALKNISVNGSLNGAFVSNLTSSLRRQTSAPVLPTTLVSNAKEFHFSDSNSNEERVDGTRFISRIPEDIDEDDEVEEKPIKPVYTQERRRRNAVTNGCSGANNNPSPSANLSRRKALSVDNVFTNFDLSSTSTSDTSAALTSSSASSSNTSLNNCNNALPQGSKTKSSDMGRGRSSSDAGTLSRKHCKNANADDLVLLYQNHCRRTRPRRIDSTRSLGNNFTSMTFNPTQEVSGY